MRPRRLVIRTVIVVGIMSLIAPLQPAMAEGPTINGGGSSFAQLEIDAWKAAVARKPFSLTVNYVAQGSTFGRNQFASGTFDFGATDIPYQPLDQPKPGFGFVYVPISAGGVGFMYNLRDSSGNKVTDLKLTRRAACRIFTEPGIRWNDAEIVRHNPRLAGVDRDILPVVRSDGSGTSFVLAQFCVAVARDVWQAYIDRLALTAHPEAQQYKDAFREGRGTSNWAIPPSRMSSSLGADGVANSVADQSNGKDRITYNEAGFAKVRGFPNASVQNESGQFTDAENREAVTVALGYAAPNTAGGQEDGTFRLEYAGSDPRAYFPSTYSYALARTSDFPADKGQVLSRFLCYAATKGQEVAGRLGYAPLSSVLVDLALRQIARIPGFPGVDNCKVAGAAAPPPPPELQPGKGAKGGANGEGAEARDGTGEGAAGEGGPEEGGQGLELLLDDGSLGGEEDGVSDEADLDSERAAAESGRVTGREVLWLLLQGGILCGLAVGAAGWRRGSA